MKAGRHGSRIATTGRDVKTVRSPRRAGWAVLVAVLLGLGGTAAAEEARPGPGFGKADLDAWRRLPVLQGGRIMPVDSFADVAASIVSNGRVRVTPAEMLDVAGVAAVAGGDLRLTVDGSAAPRTPVELALAFLREPGVWRGRAVIAVPEGPLRKLLPVDATGRVSYEAARGSEPFAALVTSAQAKRKAVDGESGTEGAAAPAELTPEERDAVTVEGRLARFAAMTPASPTEREAIEAAAAVFPLTDGEGRPMTYSVPSEEAILSWMIEPAAWEALPFLPAAHEDIRTLLGLPLTGVDGGHLSGVSPLVVTRSKTLRTYFQDLRARQQKATADGGRFQPNGLDSRVQTLLEAHHLFRSLAIRGDVPLTAADAVQLPGGRTHLLGLLGRAMQLAQEPGRGQRSLMTWVSSLGEMMADQPFGPAAQDFGRRLVDVAGVGSDLMATQKAIDEGLDPYEAQEDYGLPRAEVAGKIEAFAASAERFATFASEQRATAYAGTKLSPEVQRNIGPIFRELASKADELARLGREMRLAVDHNDDGLMVVPALSVDALSDRRDITNESLPWLPLSVIVQGELGPAYPEAAIASVRKDWADLVAVWTDRGAADRAARVEAAVGRLAASIGNAGRQITTARDELVARELPADERDEAIVAYTRYPTDRSRLDAEVRYNALSPFVYSCVLALMATTAFLLAFGMIRRPMVFAGAGLLAVTIAWTIYAFSLRVYITGWAPVTNMFETVVYVPFVIAVLGLWLMLLPLVWPGVRAAWQITALPFTPEAGTPTAVERRMLSPTGWQVARCLLLPVRAAAVAAVAYLLCVAPLADGNRAIIELAPPQSATANDWTVYVMSFLMGLGLVYLLPRLVPAAVLAFLAVPWAFALAEDRPARFDQVVARQPLGLAAAIGAALLFLLAWFVPLFGGTGVLNPHFQPLQPVLRSNYWLVVHVMIIVASYGAGLLAWLVGMIALTQYLVGPYRRPQVPADLPAGYGPAGGAAMHKATPLPPEATADLAQYAYRAVQVAVVLLVAGTILGGIWADVSWGRFWGWDPKEVWALITLMVYLTILHGRFTGWFNHFGMIFGTVLGMTMIVMSWYGVNFALPTLKGGNVGLHSYGTGEGGLWWVAGFVIANWVFLGLTTARYLSTMGRQVAPTSSTAAEPALVRGGDDLAAPV